MFEGASARSRAADAGIGERFAASSTRAISTMIDHGARRWQHFWRRSMAMKVGIIGSGNIGTDLMIKVLRASKLLEMGALAGVDPDSDGLARARRMVVPVSDQAVDRLLA